MKSPWLSAMIVALCAVSLQAGCGSTSCPIDLNALQNFGRFSLDLSYQSIDQDVLRGTAFFSHHDEIRTVNHLTALQFAYAASASFQLAVTAPFVSRMHTHRDIDSGGGSAELEQWRFSGAGDAVVQARTRIAPKLWLTTAVKLPTGSTHEASSGGEDAEVTITPGTGSTDAIVGLTYESGFVRDTALSGPLGHATRIPYFFAANVRRNGRGRDDYRRGDELQLNAGAEYPLGLSVHLVGQLNARLASRDAAGRTDEDPALTGGRTLFASPGLRFMLGRGSSAYAIVQVPLVQHPNGRQLTARANYAVGIRQQFRGVVH